MCHMRRKRPPIGVFTFYADGTTCLLIVKIILNWKANISAYSDATEPCNTGI